MSTSDQHLPPRTRHGAPRHHLWLGADAARREQGLEAARDRRLVEIGREGLERGTGRFGGSTF